MDENFIIENNVEQKLMTLLSGVLDMDISTITDETSPNNTETWDSYTGLIMVFELESTFSVKFTMEEAVSVKNVGDIKKALNKYGINFN